jgi:hypothetical protein
LFHLLECLAEISFSLPAQRDRAYPIHREIVTNAILPPFVRTVLLVGLVGMPLEPVVDLLQHHPMAWSRQQSAVNQFGVWLISSVLFSI